MGYVTNIFPGTQSGFVDIGLERNAVLYAADIEPFNGTQNKRPIETLLRTGQKIVVQILRDAAGDKGAHVTTRLSLPGKYSVLLPDSDQHSVSRKITDQREIGRLREMAKKYMPEGCGLIIRTEASGIPEDAVASDVAVLAERLRNMRRNEASRKIPDCVHIETDFYRDILFRAIENDITRVIVDERPSYRELLNRASVHRPDVSYKIHQYDEPWPLFAFYGIQNDVNNLHSRRIWLKCGAYIIIDRTEAMTVVDVNTGKYNGGENQRETFMRANREAVAETARQMRLRDIGGIVVVDALKMDNAYDQREIVGALEAELAKDRQQTAVAGFTKLGLIEMTRKKAGTGLRPAADLNNY
jgi:ribonuclease G